MNASVKLDVKVGDKVYHKTTGDVLTVTEVYPGGFHAAPDRHPEWPTGVNCFNPNYCIVRPLQEVAAEVSALMKVELVETLSSFMSDRVITTYQPNATVALSDAELSARLEYLKYRLEDALNFMRI